MWSTERNGPLVVCVVESSPAICSILRLSLKEPEFRLRFFPDIPALRDFVSEERPDVLLMNMSIRQEEGPDPFLSDQTGFLFDSVPLILLAGVFEEPPSSLPESPGCRALVRVPFDSGELARLIRSIGREENSVSEGTADTNPSSKTISFGPDLERLVRRIVREELQKGDKEYSIPEEPE
ncbi:MAG: response regulator [Candidatus Aminicenantes bacterium]|nr:response regulator [Candidatus Aminicenantes bacterium]